MSSELMTIVSYDMKNLGFANIRNGEEISGENGKRYTSVWLPTTLLRKVCYIPRNENPFPPRPGSRYRFDKERLYLLVRCLERRVSSMKSFNE